MNDKTDNIRLHKHILLCGDNRNSLCILRSLAEKDITPTTIMLKGGLIPLLSNSRYIGEHIIVKDYDEALTRLMTYADKQCPPFVYLTDDNQLQDLDMHFDALKDKFYFFNAGAQGRVTQFLSKERQCELAEQCGLRVPKYEEVERGQLPIKISYPLITKTYNSYSSGWKRDVTICNNADELQEAYKQMISERLLLQEYVVKTGEYYIQGISINGGEDVYIPFEAEYLNYTKTAFGWYSEYRPFNNPEVSVKVKSLLREIGFSWCFEVEFLIDEKRELHFLEINMRFSGANYGVNIGGVNMPYVWAQSVLKNRIDTSDLHRSKEKYYMVNDMKAVESLRTMPFLKWLKIVRSADGYYVYNKNDKKPFVYWLLSKIKRYILRKI